jgi:4-diphosphocytidyl-2-C-methyl-D-erythritol kinase
MNLRRGNFTWTALAPAKLNLFLEVYGRRADGFHELETLMVPIRLADSLRLTALPECADGRSGEIRFKLRNTSSLSAARHQHAVPAGSENLVVRALELLRERSGSRMGAEVELVKRIPTAAGLGGGSSDAAAALRLANRAWKLNWPNQRLAGLAAELGSDVPFFLANGAAFCGGRGEKIEPIRGMRPMHFVVVKPPHDLRTADVYHKHASLTAGPAQDSTPLRRVIQNSASSEWGGRYTWMLNRLQRAAASLSPWVDRLAAAFDSLDFVRHQLSGSGTAYFGVCRHARHANRLASILRTRQLGLVFATRSCC